MDILIEVEKIEINTPEIIARLNSDKAGLFISDQWKNLIDPYVPRDTGNLMRNVDTLPFALHYKEPYASDVYYNVYGVTFIRQGSGRNPYATQEWDIAAAEAGQLAKLYTNINKALRKGII
jgi:hypothetical protein